MINISMGRAYVFSLLNGSELIAKVEEDSIDIWHLTNALQFTMQPKIDPSTQQQIGATLGLTLAAHLGDESRTGQDLSVPKSAVALIYEPRQELNDYYIQQTGSLVLAKA